MDASLSGDGEAQLPNSASKRGGWITFPFMIASMAGLSLAAGGWVANLIVFLMEEFHVKSIHAAKIYNIVNGFTTMFPIVAAIIADSFLGCFSVIWISTFVSLLGIVLLELTPTVDSLRPRPCENGSSFCRTPSNVQFGVLYAGLALASVGVGGARYTIGPMGADQFDKPKHQSIFLNWYIFTMYTSTVISSTAIVYVEDNISWGLGFGLCVASNIVGLAIFLLGSRFYHHLKPQGSPFTGLARVIVAAIRKRKVLLSLKIEDYFHGQHDGATKVVPVTPTKTFEFLNRAALRTEGDIQSDGSIAKPWRLCTLQQVEDLKSLIKILPLWSTGLFLCTPLDIQSSLLIIQALTMDRHLGPHFKIPAGSMWIFILLSTSTTIAVFDRLLNPMWQRLTRRHIKPLQRVGVGHVLTVLSMIVSAVVETKRLKVAISHNLPGKNGSIVPMSVLWLVPQLVIAGIGEAFHFPGQVSLYYQEFPTALKNTSTAMVAMFVGIAYYLSNGVIDRIQSTTGWLPDDINIGRLDNVYWVCAAIAAANFSYYLVCSWRYEYQNIENEISYD